MRVSKHAVRRNRVVLGTLLLALVAPAVSAQEKGRVITISEVTIVGRVQKPVAAVDVSRLRPKLALTELHKQFVYRIRTAVRQSPF